MAISDGTYLIINAKSGKALDVKGGSEKSGANVQQYTPNNSDAQIWAVTQQGDYWQIMCSLTDRVLDVYNGTMANGTNVQQWADKDSDAQRWQLVADGNSATYGGKTYSTYVIKCKKNTTYVLDVSGGSTAAGANIQIWSYNSTAVQQRWMLVPIIAMTEKGTYSIVSALDTSLCVDIGGASTANGAKAQVYTRNDTNAQIFEAEVNAQSQLVRLVATHSGKALDSDGATKNGTKVHQWAKANTDNQWWLIERYGTAKVDGQTVPTYRLRTRAASGRCMDVAGGKSAAGTLLQCWNDAAVAAQKFAFVKTEMLGESIPAPTGCDAVVQGRGYLTHPITFYCDETKYQARHRVFTYSIDHKSTTNGGWHSLDDAVDTAREGWSDAWTPTFTVRKGGEITVPDTFADATLEAGVLDKLVWEIEIRAFRSSYGTTHSKAHGPVTRSIITFTLKPELTVNSVAMAASGVEVSLSCDYPHAGNRYAAELWLNGERVARQETATGAGTAKVKIPISSMGRMLLVGDEVEVRASVLTADGGTDSKRVTMPVTWTGGVTGATATVSMDTDTLSAIVSCPGAAGGKCMLEVTDGGVARLVECLELPDGTWRVPYPFGTHWRAIVFRNVSGGWVMSVVEGDSSSVDEYVWLWGEEWDDCLRLRANADDRPRQSRSHGTDSATSVTTGRVRPVAFGGTSVSLDLSVEAATFGDSIPHSKRVDVERLSWALGDGWYPVFRSPKGDWHRVAVTRVDTGWDNGLWDRAHVEQEAVQP